MTLLAALGALLGRSCSLLGCSWPLLGCSCSFLRRSWLLLGRYWAALEAQVRGLGKLSGGSGQGLASFRGVWAGHQAGKWPRPWPQADCNSNVPGRYPEAHAETFLVDVYVATWIGLESQLLVKNPYKMSNTCEFVY